MKDFLLVFTEHDDRNDPGYSGGGQGRGRGHYNNHNRVWTKDGANKKQVSFKDRGGGIKKRLGPKNQHGNLANIVFDGDEDMGQGIIS